MVAVAIKNSILVLLIILILHFLIKNHTKADSSEDFDTQTPAATSEIDKYFVTSQESVLSTTCDANLKKNNEEDTKKVKADCDIPQTKKDMSILKEYENENDMTSFEPLYNNVQSFDNYDVMFAEYTSNTCKAG